VENGGKGGEEGWVDDVLEISSGVTGGPGSGHAVDEGGLMGMVVESIRRGEIVVIKLRGEGKVH
jgi:hypothetical protein